MLEDFFIKYRRFMSQYLSLIVDYYSENTRTFPQDAIAALFDLFTQFLIVKNAYDIPTQSLKQTLDREQLYAIQTTFLKLFSINRWLRSSITAFGKSTQLKQVNILNQNEATDAYIQQQPFDFFFTNNLLEQDYSLEGGNSIEIAATASTNKKLESVVDYSQADTRKGKDISRIFSFSDTDIVTVEKDACVIQQVENLLIIRKGDIYSSPHLGISQEVLIGTTQNLLNLPVLTREMQILFNTDDFFIDFYIIDFLSEQDNLSIDFALVTIDGTVVSKTLSL